MKSFLILVYIIISPNFFFAQKIYNDFSVILHEETINKVFAAVGEISGKNEFEALLIKGHYKWTVVNPKINLLPDSSDFTCDAKVEVGPFKYRTQVTGNVKIGYDNELNEISVKISKAIFELYTVILGNKIHIKDIHLEDNFKDPFRFEGPKSFATDMSLTMPDSTIKRIYVQPTECVMQVLKQMISTSCEVVASDKPIDKKVKVKPPIQPVDRTKEMSIKK